MEGEEVRLPVEVWERVLCLAASEGTTTTADALLRVCRAWRGWLWPNARFWRAVASSVWLPSSLGRPRVRPPLLPVDAWAGCGWRAFVARLHRLRRTTDARSRDTIGVDGRSSVEREDDAAAEGMDDRFGSGGWAIGAMRDGGESSLRWASPSSPDVISMVLPLEGGPVAILTFFASPLGEHGADAPSFGVFVRADLIPSAAIHDDPGECSGTGYLTGGVSAEESSLGPETLACNADHRLPDELLAELTTSCPKPWRGLAPVPGLDDGGEATVRIAFSSLYWYYVSEDDHCFSDLYRVGQPPARSAPPQRVGMVGLRRFSRLQVTEGRSLPGVMLCLPTLPTSPLLGEWRLRLTFWRRI